jgi:hypothetical protein
MSSAGPDAHSGSKTQSEAVIEPQAYSFGTTRTVRHESWSVVSVEASGQVGRHSCVIEHSNELGPGEWCVVEDIEGR